MTEETMKQDVTVTEEGLNVQGWKETALIIGTVIMQFCFIVANVQSPLIGFPDLNDNRTKIHTGDEPHIEQFGHIEQLLEIGSHLHVVSMVLPGFHTPNEIQVDNTVNTELSQQTNISRQLRQPPQPTQQEQEEHRITHMPYRSWCPICVKAKGQPQHHNKDSKNNR
eukprot:964526-Amphidinium_carterae.4